MDRLFEKLYEDNVAGKISDDRFAKLSGRYEEEESENENKIKILRKELQRLEASKMDTSIFLETVRRYTDATELTRRMVTELIDHIDVYQANRVSGIASQKIVIHYNCIGPFVAPKEKGIPELDVMVETRRGAAVSYTPPKIAI